MKTTKRGGGSKAGKPVPAEGLPSGWMTRDKPRYATFGNKDSMRKYWYSPILKLQFRSLQSARRFLPFLKRANGDEGTAMHDFRQNSTIDADRKGWGSNDLSVALTKSSETTKPRSVVNVGDVGYKFRKEFHTGWYNGTVVEIRPHADVLNHRCNAGSGKDRRCVYEDGDCEDLSLIELQTLAILDPNVTKKKPSSAPKATTKTPKLNDATAHENGYIPKSERSTCKIAEKVERFIPKSNDAAHLPLPRNGSVYSKTEAYAVLSVFPKFTRERGLAVRMAHENGYIPSSERNIYKFLQNAERGGRIVDTNWGEKSINYSWDLQFSKLKEYKRKYGHTSVTVCYDRKLYDWAAGQRRNYNRFLRGENLISQRHVDLLKSIGFAFGKKGNGERRSMMSSSHGEVKQKIIDSVSEKIGNSKRTSMMSSSHEEVSMSRKSKRAIRPPQKVDEIYSYEHMKNYYRKSNSHEDDSSTSRHQSKKAPADPSTPERHILSAFNDEIPMDKAAASTLNAENSGDVRPDGINSYDSDGDDREWLEKVAASLGAEKPTLRQKRLAPPSAANLKKSPSPNRLFHPKSEIAYPRSSITCQSDTDVMEQLPQSVLSHMLSVSQDPVNNVLLSEYKVGSRYGTYVIHKNDKRCRVGEVILEHGDTWVEVAISGTLKKYHITHLVVVPSKHSKANGSINVGYGSARSSLSKKMRAKPSPSEMKPPSFIKEISPNEENVPPKIEPNISKKEKVFPMEKKFSALSADHLFCWFCDICDAANNPGAGKCNTCNARKPDEPKMSILLGIAENAVRDEAKTAEEAMGCIPYSDRASIPKKLIEYLLEAKSLGQSNAGMFTYAPRSIVETYFYWMCGYCTTQNSYKKTTCSACLQGKGLADRSPLLKIAEDAAMNSQNSDDALLLVPPHERLVMPKAVMDALVTCVFIITNRYGQQRRCRKAKKDGFDYCEAHCEPLLLIRHEKYHCSGGQLCNVTESLSNDNEPTYSGKISMINEVMPSLLSTIQSHQGNELRWTINSIEDSVLCGESTAFPLGMTIRKFFTNYGFHDGRIIKVVRKIWADSERRTDRPVLVYRCIYNDGDEEDFLHHELVSLSQLYDKRNVPPEAPPHEQIPPKAIFESRSGHTFEIIGHKTPLGCNTDEGGIVMIKFCSSSKCIELGIEELQKAILRKVGGLIFPTESSPLSSYSDEENKTAIAPVLEWPIQCQSKADGESGCVDERIEILKGFSLHQKRYFASSDDHVPQFLTTSCVNNPSDFRSGVSVGMWDPASSYDHLLWDPYASTVCEVCGVNKDDNQVVICDACHKGFHTYCLRPLMVNIPRGDWWCSACSGRSNVQLSYAEFKANMSTNTREIFQFVGLPFNSPDEFFKIHSDAIGLFSVDSQAAIKQHAISRQVGTKHIVFDVTNVKFIRSPEKNDWRLPTPILSEKGYISSILSMVAAMKYCGMESNLSELAYTGNATEEMNDPSLEVDGITPMSKRNLEIYRAFLHNLKQGVLPPVEIFHDENFGFSVKALGFMRKHTLIGGYLGEIVTMEQSGLSSSDSLMVLLDTGNPKTSLIIDPTRAGNIARFLSGINNRSLVSRRKRNVRTRRFVMDGKMHVCLFTCRPVEAGEILNYDYNAGNEGKDIGQWTKTGFYDTSNFF